MASELIRTPRADVARASQWPRRRIAATAGTGCALGALIVVVGARLSAPEPAQARLLGSWLGLLTPSQLGGTAATWLTVLLLVAVAALVVAWALVVRACSKRRVSLEGAAAMSVAWSLPFVTGPPLFSRDVYSFVAQGQLTLRGLNPYRVAPVHLGPSALLAAVGPHWRTTTDPYGPLAVRLEELSALAGRGLGAVLVLRAAAVVAVVVTILCATRMVPRDARPTVVVLYGLCPLVLIHLVSGVHLEAEMAALMVAGLMLHRRGHPVAGLCLIGAAGAVKAPALLAAAVLLWADARGVDVRGEGAGAPKALTAARDAGATVVGFAACSFLVADPLGWVRAMGTSDAGRTLTMPSSILGHALAHAGLHPATALTAADLALAAGAAAAIVWLLATSGRRDAVRTAGFALLLCGVLGPVLHPWYVVWGLAALLPAAGTRRVRRLLTACCAGLILFDLPTLPASAGPRAWILAVGLLFALVAVTASLERRPGPGAIPPEPARYDAMPLLPHTARSG